jgi:hypothetical protein
MELYNILVGKHEGKRSFVRSKRIKAISEKQSVKLWSGFIGLRIGVSDVLL